MAFGIVAYHQFGNLRRQLLRICHPYLFGHTVRSHTHIAAHHVFEADKDLELLEAFLAVLKGRAVKLISTAQYSADITAFWRVRRQLATNLTDDTGNGGAAVFTISSPYSLVNLAG
mgnify:CR=1 FL=1